MVEAGAWRAEAPDHFSEHNRHASFHLWAAYSASPNAAWGQLATEYVKAARNPIELRTYKNTVLGEPWKEALVVMDWEALYRRRETCRIGTAPRGVLFVTAGVDVQQDRLVYEVVGWGRGKTSWSLDAGTLEGDTANARGDAWTKLDALLGRSYPHAAGLELR